MAKVNARPSLTILKRGKDAGDLVFVNVQTCFIPDDPVRSLDFLANWELGRDASFDLLIIPTASVEASRLGVRRTGHTQRQVKFPVGTCLEQKWNHNHNAAHALFETTPRPGFPRDANSVMENCLQPFSVRFNPEFKSGERGTNKLTNGREHLFRENTRNFGQRGVPRSNELASEDIRVDD